MDGWVDGTDDMIIMASRERKEWRMEMGAAVLGI